eukprot:SAG22_NODE_24_length_30194_cov_6.086327_9_plen_222_part_00
MDFSDPEQLKELFGAVVTRLDTVEKENVALQNRAQVLETENIDFRSEWVTVLKEVKNELKEVKDENTVLQNRTLAVEAELRQEKVKVHDLQSSLLELASRMKDDVQNVTLRLDQCEVHTHPFVKEMQTLQRRRLQDEETLCRGSGMIGMFAECCSSPGDSDGHRRFMQTDQGCDALPSTCSASCAPLFIEYFEGCQGMLDDLAPDQRQIFVEFYGGCQEVE